MARRKSSHSNKAAARSRAPAIELPTTESLAEYVELVLTMTEAAFNAAELDFGIIRQQRTVEVEMPADIRDTILRHVQLEADLESRLRSAHGESFELPLSLDDLAAICTALSTSLELVDEDDELAQVAAGMGECLTSVLSEFLMEIADEVAPKENSAGGKRKSAAAAAVYELKITLAGVNPPVWRRVEVRDCSLAELHRVIQRAMGWEFSHLYSFEVGKRQYGDPNMLDGAEGDDGDICLSDLVESRTKKFSYTYDFGDDWEHEIKIEKTLAAESKVKYPRCTDGARACPPEDCGGAWGYDSFLAAVRDPKHEQHNDMLEWCGGKFDPEAFDVERVNKALKPRK